MNAHAPRSPASEDPRAAVPPLAWAPQFAENFDLRRLMATFRRHLRLFGAVVLTVLLATILLTMQAKPMYTATATVMLDPRQSRVTNVDEVLSGLPPEAAVVDTEVEVLRSRQLGERVVRSLKLDQDPEFNHALRKPEGLAALQLGIKSLAGASAPDATPRNPVQAQIRLEEVVDVVLSRLNVYREGNTRLINVSFVSEDPQKAAKIANQFSELYRLEQLEAKFDATRQATQWLNTRLGELRGQVLQAEAAVQQFRIANNLLSASGTNLTEQEISNFNVTLAGARAQLAEDEARLRTARAQLAGGSTGDDVGEALSSPVVQQLRQQRAEVSARVADLRGRYGDRHPDMLKANRELADIDAQIQAEISRTISNLQARAEVSRQRAAAVQASLGNARGSLANNNRAMVRLNELERDAEATRTLYESYLSRFKETSTQSGIEQSDARIVSRAKIPTRQSSPNPAVNLGFGLVLALGAGIAAVVLAETLSAGLLTAEDVERRLDTAYLGGIPLLSSVAPEAKNPIDYLVAKPLSSFAEGFRNLRASLMYARLGEPVKVVAVTSALPGEGKTTTSICLARAAALQGAKVLLVDCDLRRRSINRLLVNEPAVGLIEVLNGDATLAEAVLKDRVNGLDVLHLMESAFTPRDVFSSKAMDTLLAAARESYDFVVLDTAPVLAVADARLIGPKTDVVVFLARWGKTPEQATAAALRQFAGTGAYVAGVALTQVDMQKQSRYGYGDPGYFYGEYKNYYASAN